MTIPSRPIDWTKEEAKHLLETPSMAAEMKAMQDSLKANNIQPVGGRATRSASRNSNRAVAAPTTQGPKRKARQTKVGQRGKSTTKAKGRQRNKVRLKCQ